MSKTLGTVFDLKEIFVKATDLIFRGTPAERVVALARGRNVRRQNSRIQPFPDCDESTRRECWKS